ncbi:hypothetical protein ACJQWK_03922 [Exserohilum turcicum]
MRCMPHPSLAPVQGPRRLVHTLTLCAPSPTHLLTYTYIITALPDPRATSTASPAHTLVAARRRPPASRLRCHCVARHTNLALLHSRADHGLATRPYQARTHSKPTGLESCSTPAPEPQSLFCS